MKRASRFARFLWRSDRFSRMSYETRSRQRHRAAELCCTYSLHTNGATARRAGARAVIADNGPGISAGNREKIFEPFFTTKGENGTGLGLWVTSGIILKHGGSIRVRTSTRRGRSGTVFNIFLPFEPPHSQEQSPVGFDGTA